MIRTLNVDEDGMLILTPEILEETGWKEGDELEWIDLKDGSFQLRKATSVNEDT